MAIYCHINIAISPNLMITFTMPNKAKTIPLQDLYDLVVKTIHGN